MVYRSPTGPASWNLYLRLNVSTKSLHVKLNDNNNRSKYVNNYDDSSKGIWEIERTLPKRTVHPPEYQMALGIMHLILLSQVLFDQERVHQQT